MMGMLGALADAIDELELPVDTDVVAEALRLVDRLTAKVSVAVGELDAADLWDTDGAHSMTSWLRTRAGMTNGDAHRTASTAKRLRSCPLTRDAWLDGAITGGQVRAITANVTDHTAGRYAEHEAELIPRIATLDVRDTLTVMRSWAAAADDDLDRPEPPQPERRLHLSRTLGGRGELTGSFDPEGTELIATALRVCQTPDIDGDGEPARTPAQRRGDALVDVCRWFLDHQQTRRGGRHRPHLNAIIDLDDLEHRGQGRLTDGTPLDATTMRRLLCDCGIHRVITGGRSTILDYGRTTRTISPELWTSLIVRDGGCRAPWCDRGPAWCEGHHILPWEDGGSTRLDNLAMYCTRDHHRFHSQAWEIKLRPDGTIDHIAPDGRVYTSHPPPRE